MQGCYLGQICIILCKFSIIILKTNAGTAPFKGAILDEFRLLYKHQSTKTHRLNYYYFLPIQKGNIFRTLPDPKPCLQE